MNGGNPHNPPWIKNLPLVSLPERLPTAEDGDLAIEFPNLRQVAELSGLEAVDPAGQVTDLTSVHRIIGRATLSHSTTPPSSVRGGALGRPLGYRPKL